jgi:hypothetical protein
MSGPLTRNYAGRGPHRAGLPILAVALLVAAALAAACGSSGPTNTANETQIPFGPSAWPSGTTGQYGLHIDPSLLGRLPRSVGAYTLVENTDSEKAALDDQDLARTFDRYAAASIGTLGDDNWLQLVIGHERPESQTPDIYTAWVDQYATGACSQADGVSGSSQPTINSWVVDVSTCAGGPIVYTLILGDGLLLSMYDLGPKDLGRMLINQLN